MEVLRFQRRPDRTVPTRNYTRPTYFVCNYIPVILNTYSPCMSYLAPPAPFNPPKESTKVQYVASPNSSGTLLSLVVLISL
jgi:hypothetical protein